MRKFLLTESEKNEIKSLYRSKGILIEDRSSISSESIPDYKDWRLIEWKNFYMALKKDLGLQKAKEKFLKYWEPNHMGWIDSTAKNDMDDDNSWFKAEGLWNAQTKKPFTRDEFIKISKTDLCVDGNCQDGYGVKQFKNGEFYRGNFKDGFPHGKGYKVYKDVVYELSYDGDFIGGNRWGKGKLTYKNGTLYEGDWKEDIINGKGTNTYSDGSKYEGDFKNNLINGKGTYTNAKGIKYTGDWVDNGPEGTDWDTLDKLSTQEEANQLMSQIASGASDSTPEMGGEPTIDTAENPSTTTTIDTTDCESLMEEAKKQTSYNPCNLKNGKVVIGKGNQGILVKMMQCFLNRKNSDYSLGLTELKVDGIFGNKTKEMVIKFQEQFPDDLKADGIIGKNTYAKFEIADGC